MRSAPAAHGAVWWNAVMIGPPSPNAVSGYLGSLPPSRFPNLTAVASHFAAADSEQRFDMLVDLFVDGLAQRAALSSVRP